MPMPNYQYMERLAEISQHFEKDECLPDSCRQLFSRAFDLTGNYKYAAEGAHGGSMDEAFSVVCEACKAAGLYQCKEGGFLSCQLVWNYSSQ